jgi:hypothetical protein
MMQCQLAPLRPGPQGERVRNTKGHVSVLVAEVWTQNKITNTHCRQNHKLGTCKSLETKSRPLCCSADVYQRSAFCLMVLLIAQWLDKPRASRDASIDVSLAPAMVERQRRGMWCVGTSCIYSCATGSYEVVSR